MQFKVISVPAVADSEQEETLNTFPRSHRVVGMQRELRGCGGSTRWCFCVEYLLGAAPADATRGRKYFDSVAHQTLKALPQRKLKDARFLNILDAIIDSCQRVLEEIGLCPWARTA